MIKKNINTVLKNSIKEKISLMIGVEEVSSKNVGSINMKHINNWLTSKEFSLQEYLYCLDYIYKSYFDWNVEPSDINPQNNCGRLIYLVNENIDICHYLFNKENNSIIENDETIKIKSTKDIVDYHELAEKVGL